MSMDALGNCIYCGQKVQNTGGCTCQGVLIVSTDPTHQVTFTVGDPAPKCDCGDAMAPVRQGTRIVGWKCLKCFPAGFLHQT